MIYILMHFLCLSIFESYPSLYYYNVLQNLILILFYVTLAYLSEK